MEIIIDAMGGDNAPQEIIKGAMLAMPETSADFIFVGKAEAIEAELAKYKYDASRVSIEDAREVIDNNASPVFALRKKKDSSIVKSLNMLKDHKDRVLITGGSTGAALAGGLLLVGRIEGVDRPAIAAMLPGINGGTLLIDTGANVDVKVENLLEFAILGSAYMEAVVGVKNPRIGLINNGAEEKKGNELTKKAYQALKEHKGIHFVGNVEPRDVLNSLADVLVCDGFVGLLLAVPVFAVIYYFIKRITDAKLEQKNLTLDTAAYMSPPRSITDKFKQMSIKRKKKEKS